MIKREDLPEAFCDSVAYTVRQGSVDPKEIEDLALRNIYQNVCKLYADFTAAARRFQYIIDEITDQATPNNFYEDDEPVEQVISTFEAGPKMFTEQPATYAAPIKFTFE